MMERSTRGHERTVDFYAQHHENHMNPSFTIASRAAIAALLALTSLSLAGEASAASPHYKRLCDDNSLPGNRRCNSWIVADENDVPIRFAAAPPANSLGATDLRAAYHLPATGGNGKIIASVLGVHYPNAEADLNVYRSQYGLPPCTKANGCFIQVDAKGGTSFPQTGQCNGVAGESALDIQMLSAGCPDCKIMLIEPNGGSDTDAAAFAKSKGGVGVSFSFCGGESGTLGEDSRWKIAGLGLFASSGDWGYLSHEVNSMMSVCSPASHSGVVSVGGTTLKKNANSARGWDELVWSHAGSGCSTVIPKPPYQTDPGCKMKMVADLSAIAENVANYCTDPGGGNSGWGAVGGTSASSPFVAGALAVMGVLDGNFDPAWVWQHANQFYDITSGNNGTCGNVSSYYCQGSTGYDGPTGVGTPNGMMSGGGSDAGPPVVDASGGRDAARDTGRPGDATATTGGPDASSGGTGGSGAGGAATGAGGSTTSTTSTTTAGGSDVTSTTSSSATTGAGGATTGTATGTGTSTGTGVSTTSATGSGGASPNPKPGGDDQGGCACRVGTGSHGSNGIGAWALLAAAALVARGSRRKRSA